MTTVQQSPIMDSKKLESLRIELLDADRWLSHDHKTKLTQHLDSFQAILNWTLKDAATMRPVVEISIRWIVSQIRDEVFVDKIYNDYFGISETSSCECPDT